MRTTSPTTIVHPILKWLGAAMAAALVLAAPVLASGGAAAVPVTGGTQQIQQSDIRPPAEDIAAALQRHYEAIHDFSANFTQVYEGGPLRRKVTESGTVHVKKPGKMRWDYTAPEKKLFISDGRTMFMYFPADRQVMTNPVPEDDQATSAVLFLMGKGNIVRDFTVRFGQERGGESTYVLRLEPRARQAEYDWLQLTADRTTFQIRELAWGDAQGGRNTITLSNFKANIGLADKLFRFSIPRGTEVITSGKSD